MRSRPRAGGLLAILLLVSQAAVAQQDTSLGKARAAYDGLDYAGAILAARQALGRPLSLDERVAAYELLGFSYGALDSTKPAVDAFRQLIFLAPDREPDVERVSPRITSLYASALGQVLVVRRILMDSASFVAGAGTVPIRFEVSRSAQTYTRILGSGVDLIVDSQTVAGAGRVDLSLTRLDGSPLPAGEYEIIVTAREGSRNEYASHPIAFRLGHGRLDTLPHLASLAGYQEQPELVSPPRDWRPLALTVLYAGVVGGIFLAIDNGDLGTGPRTAMWSVGGASVATGIVLSLRQPEPRPSPTNVLYNRLLRELLARRNQEIAHENATRRAQVLLVATPAR